MISIQPVALTLDIDMHICCSYFLMYAVLLPSIHQYSYSQSIKVILVIQIILSFVNILIMSLISSLFIVIRQLTYSSLNRLTFSYVYNIERCINHKKKRFFFCSPGMKTLYHLQTIIATHFSILKGLVTLIFL